MATQLTTTRRSAGHIGNKVCAHVDLGHVDGGLVAEGHAQELDVEELIVGDLGSNPLCEAAIERTVTIGDHQQARTNIAGVGRQAPSHLSAKKPASGFEARHHPAISIVATRGRLGSSACGQILHASCSVVTWTLRLQNFVLRPPTEGSPFLPLR